LANKTMRSRCLFSGAIFAILAITTISSPVSGTAGGLLETNIGPVILGANDDDSTAEIPLPFPVSIFGDVYSNFWINNNGNTTYTGPLSQFTSFAFPNEEGVVIVAPFFADVDTDGAGSGYVHYNTFADHVAVTWDHVGYFPAQTDKLDTFQLVIYSPVTNQNLFAFSYSTMQWTTGDASGGDDGLGGAPAHGGFDAGDGSNAVVFFSGNTAAALTNIADQTFYYLSGTGSPTNAPLTVAIPLIIQLVSNKVVLTWDDPESVFVLQAAPDATFAFTNLAGATSPYTNAITDTQQFFRLSAPGN